MHVESSAPARARVFEVTPARFRTLAFAAVGALYVIVSTGATVRLTGSGLGCEHWPGCQPGNPFPEKGYHSYIEFGNRMVAGTTIVLTLLAWLASRRTEGLPRWTPRLAFAVFVGTLVQAPLGALQIRAQCLVTRLFELIGISVEIDADHFLHGYFSSLAKVRFSSFQ